ncbi:hypothetical protein KAT08_02500 [Candidatus Babeliales bacterium]|nr:hypothetical protein [Candidatus Babeliales bacterium]
MKKLLKGILILALVATGVRAATNKTFFLPRPHGVNLAMEYTTWNELLQTKDEDRFGAHFQVTPFYMDSTDGDDLGKYFGILNKHNFLLNTVNATDLRGTYIIHDGGTAACLAGVTGVAPVAANAVQLATMKFDPEQTAYGVRIDYYQDLRKILKGLYFKIALPIIHVENDLQLNITGANAGANANIAAVATAAVVKSQFEHYFKGTLDVPTDQPAPISAVAHMGSQQTLKYAKIDGQQSSFSIADIDFVLGYKVLDKEKYNLALNIGLTIPTGDSADGVWLWEPVVGNGDHWALGGGLDFGAKLWEDEDQNIKMTAALNYRYLFESTEKRTIGIDGKDWGQYYLLGQVGTNRAVQTLIPAANVLTRDLDVEPGSQLDAILAFAYNNGGFTIDLGYNLFWKDAEDVKLKGTWTNNQYGIAHINQTMNNAQNFEYSATAAAVGDAGGAEAYLNDQTNLTAAIPTWGIDVSKAATPSQITHKIYGGVGYIFKEWEYPLMLGLAGHYEFASDDGIDNWGVWGKVGIAF